MAEPRKVPFVTISSFSAVPPPPAPEPGKKRRREDDGEDISLGKDGGGSPAGEGAGGGGAHFGSTKGDETGESKPTLRLSLSLNEPSDRGSVEFNYTELSHSTHTQVKTVCSTAPKVLTPALDPSDPFADDDKERHEVEELAKKFESKYGNGGAKKKKKDRMQDLIDIGFGYDETDPFIDNSEAYDELVPASLTTKHGGFYINTGTLQFRPASDTEGEDTNTTENHLKKVKDGEERVIKKRRKKQDGGILEEKKPKKNKVPKSGVSALNAHRPEKKKRKKLMKDSLNLANMLRRFNREKEEMRKKNIAGGLLQRANPKLPNPKLPPTTSSLLSGQIKPPGNNDCNMADLTTDPVVISLLGAANNDILQDMMGDLDFGMLDSPHSPGQGENGSFGPGHKGRVSQGSTLTPPLPGGLPAPLAKRIEDLRTASRQFDDEGRKKFFTLDMNNILLDIELQVQEQPSEVRSAVYSHLEAFVPCNKEALLKRLKKLSLNIQDDRLRTPLLKLKLAVCSVMPEQIARYNMDCIAKVAKQQEEGERNGSDDDDEEKPGKRVMGPRKKFVWDDKLRTLLCNLVRIKLNCYEIEGKNTVSLEDYLKGFMESEVKPLWPKGWMQARMLFKESTMVHGYLTGYAAKKKVVSTPKAKPKESAIWTQRATPSTGPSALPIAKRRPQSPSEPICLDSLGDLPSPSLDSISQALAILGNAAKGLAQGESPPSPEAPKPPKLPTSLHASPVLQQHKKNSVSITPSSTPHYISTSTSSLLSRPASLSASPQGAVRGPGVDSLGKNSPQLHRHSVLNTHRPMSVGVAKANMLSSATPPKPRPPATSSPLMAPLSLMKGSSSKDTLLLSSPQSRPHMLQSTPPHLTPKPYTPSRLPQTAPPSSQPQSNFITPMHATLTKPTHSNIAPIIKLSPRAPSPAVSASSSPALSQPPRSQATPIIHQYSPKSPASFRPQFSGSPGAAGKLGPGIFSVPGQKTPSSTTSCLINSSPVNKHTVASITAVSASQRQRLGPGTPQGAKVSSTPLSTTSPQITQVSTSGSSSLLGSSPTLPLGFGMLGGLVPVSLPFQFPSLLNLNSVGTAGSSTTASGSTASSNTPFSTLTQNVAQSQADVKRKTL
ncbi:ubinuclein-2b isoform X2 [Eucyclogobius newberryi]|uniref:ubinuclein-2b isoform X2 n=1 Tax=Eucyclogobius newberryi TaxID=166745 RepID=UPI003B5A1B1D